MRARNIPVAVAAVTLAWALPGGAEDLTVIAKVTAAKGAPKTATTYITNGKFRHSDGEHDAIMDVASGKLVTIDHARKEYWETTLDEMRAMMQKADEQMKQAQQKMQEQMEQNPQAAAMMQKMMGGLVGQVTVQKGTASRKIAGYDCDEYIISVGDVVKTDIWATAALQPPAQMYEMRRALVPAAPGPMGGNFAKMFDEMRKIKGYTLAETTTIKIMGMGSTTTTEATEVKRDPIPASAFDVAAVASGYKKTEAPFKRMAR